jgi:hypothetical protein
LKKKLLIIVAIVLVALGASAFVMFKFVLNNGDATEKPKEVKQEKPVPKAYLELERSKTCPSTPAARKGHCAAEPAVRVPGRRQEPAGGHRSHSSPAEGRHLLYLESQTLEDYGVDNRQMLENSCGCW